MVAAADTKESLGELSKEVKDLHAVACDVLKRDSVSVLQLKLTAIVSAWARVVAVVLGVRSKLCKERASKVSAPRCLDSKVQEAGVW